MSADELKVDPNLIQEFLKWHSQRHQLSSFRSTSPFASSVNNSPPPAREGAFPTSSLTHPPSPQAGVPATQLATGAANSATPPTTEAKLAQHPSLEVTWVQHWPL